MVIKNSLIVEKLETNKKVIFLGLLVIFLCQLSFCFLEIKNFTEPLTENSGTDVEQWENMSYYLAEHLFFKPYPQLNLTNNDYFYPYGGTHVFQGWFLEGNYFYAFFYNNFGNGPWLNYYYALSILFAALSIFFLVGYYWDFKKSLLVSILVTYLNFHAINRYPHHLAYCIIHWTTISIFLDYIIFKKFINKEPISTRLLIFKVMIMCLALGQDLSYILGFSLSSFFFVAITILGYCIKKDYRAYFIDVLKKGVKDFNKNMFINASMILVSFIALFFYLPIIIQVFTTIRKFHFDNPFSGGHGWNLPLRIFLPYFPNFSALNNPFQGLFNDMPEGMGSMSPGIFCLLIGLFGYLFSKKKERLLILPFAIFFLLSIINHPINIPTLQWLPWCMLYRIPSRFTMIIPFFCSFLLLGADLKKNQIKKHIYWIGLLTIIGFLEVFTVYKARFERPIYHFDSNFNAYMNYVKKLPGEAVLDWPFCVIGGNGIGNDEGLCPIYNKTSGVHALKRFHHKKVIGYYFGRLHPTLIKPFVDAGWGKMSVPDNKIWNQSTKITNKFTPEQWSFFTQFYQFNDFAGINLYIDLIPESEKEEFYKRFGKPVMQTTVPIAGRVVFLKKPQEWFIKEDTIKGKQLKFQCDCKKN
ncbi:hypothetical protein Emtol_3924 [Emticicia oligotrophica DSM 17448]|uniref:Glycosyltransferase RgtA/B/C/D-like domain-containing protein n=2 Tax=Emticicia TaxID=312278 RepID=A0ABM5N6B5_EMTOG|nr:hypothetical protein Emtol_3924 [Emticicia oligotrophica DSM 17448]